MSYTFRPAVRENTPLIVGLAGPTKSGKTYSAHRLARGLAQGGEIIMLNAEGARGHQYAETFKYTACDLVPPYRYGMYEEVFRGAMARKPGVIIIDSISHAHNGPGGFLEWHEEILDDIAGDDQKARDRANFKAWVKPKAAENAFRYALLEASCPVILCAWAKEKIKIVPGKPPIDLGWQPVMGESLAFETMFTLTLPPFAAGVPDLAISFMREPFDTLVPPNQKIDENLGKRLAEWAKGGTVPRPAEHPERLATSRPSVSEPGAAAGGDTAASSDPRAALLAEIKATILGFLPRNDEKSKKARAAVIQQIYGEGMASWSDVAKLPLERLTAGRSRLESVCADHAAALSEGAA